MNFRDRRVGGWSGAWYFIDLGQVLEITLDKIYQGAAIRQILSQLSGRSSQSMPIGISFWETSPL